LVEEYVVFFGFFLFGFFVLFFSFQFLRICSEWHIRRLPVSCDCC
jgi:lipopolysaccharide export LptBFGC system permease protein LptF